MVRDVRNGSHEPWKGGGRPGMGPGGRCPEEGDFELGVQGLEGNN